MHFEILLTVVIIIMLFMQYDAKHCKNTKPAVAPAIVADTTPVPKPVESFAGDYEKTANQENIDYYQACNLGDSARAPCSDPCNGDLEYSTHEYGAEGLDFKDWAKAQSIDPQVIKNHNEFVNDRLANSKTDNITGRTYSPDSHESYDAISWIGIRGRPQAVKICNPQQMPDINPALYTSKQRLTWASS
jgi:hypothetical protein